MKWIYLLFFTALELLVHIECKVYSRRDEADLHKVINLSKRSLESVLPKRSRRDTPTPSSTPDSKSFTISPDKKDLNEAIVHWSGEDSETIFLLLRQRVSNGSVVQSDLWRSENYGNTFTPVQLFVQDKDVIIKYFYTSPINKNKLIFTDVRHKRLYLTNDEGKSYQKNEGDSLPFSPDRLVFHPTKEDTVLGYTFEERKLFVSTDLGKTWTLLAQRVNARFFWAQPGLDPQDMTVHMEVEDLETGEYQYKAILANDKTYVTFDMDIGLIDMDSLLVQDNYMFVQKTTPFDSNLYVSYKRGPFKMAYFPKEAKPQDFSIISTDQQQVFIAADHHQMSVHLYLSDETGIYYVESLGDLIALRSSHGGFNTDITEISGINGTYIANMNVNGTLRTMITFDEGGEWSLIPAPEKDKDGHATNCQLPKCGLNLHLMFSALIYGIPSILSEDNAPGLILAQGSMGDSLNQTTQLYLSSNGGETWKMVLSGQYSHNILDQGGAIVAIKQDGHRETNTIMYSCTEGETWQSFEFESTPMLVDGVLNEPGITTRIVSIYGHSKTTPGWNIVKLNFSSVLTKKCGDDDYETWSPADTKSAHHCLLGQKVTYKRRKAMRECYNGEDYEQAISATVCECEVHDYECDFGYKEVRPEICNIEPWFDPTVPTGDCPDDGVFFKSKGYRKIPASKCSGGSWEEKYKPVSAPCPKTAPTGLNLYTYGAGTVQLGKLVTVHVIQNKGWKKDTEYKHRCGASKVWETSVGFKQSRNFTCMYTSIGRLTIELVAKNDKGAANASLVVMVDDELASVSVVEPHAAAALQPLVLEVAVEMESEGRGAEVALPAGLGLVHYAWSFGDEEGAHEQPILTYENQVKHTYVKAGNYTLTVKAFNSINSVYREKRVTVYGTLKTIQLKLKTSSDEIFVSDEQWHAELAKAIKQQLMSDFGVDHRRLEVVVLPGSPEVVDVSVLPKRQTDTSDDSIETLAQLILKAKGMTVRPDPTIFGDDFTVTITDAYFLDKSPQSMAAVYVCIPILLVAIFVSGIIVLYYRKKLSPGGRNRYAVLHSSSAQAAGGAGESLLDETDDDEPMLDDGDLQQQPAGGTHRLQINDDDPLGDMHGDPEV